MYKQGPVEANCVSHVISFAFYNNIFKEHCNFLKRYVIGEEETIQPAMNGG